MVKPRLGLALGGGAAKGWSHIGFMRALDEAGIKPDIISGTSIGAVVGGCWAAGHLDELEKFARSLTQRRVFALMDVSLSGSGLINGSRLGKILTQNLDGIEIQDLKIPFASIATELSNGNEIWLTKGHLASALQASYALPGVFKPVQIEDRWLVDGALVNPVPVTTCRALGANYVIGISLSSSGLGKGTVMANTMLATSLNEDDINGLDIEDKGASGTKQNTNAKRLVRRQILGRKDGPPGISSVMMQSFNIIQDRISRSRLAGDPPDTLVTPQIGDIGLFDFHRATEAIDAGYAAAKPIIAMLEPQFSQNSAESEKQTIAV